MSSLAGVLQRAIVIGQPTSVKSVSIDALGLRQARRLDYKDNRPC
ncbi:MAG TPA: hypothetical protein VKU02_08330 [Gemmataceae bacterium]|nr:hypothetical protein [Gemmataceae bacterium]